jgi:hypothetical protein
MSDEKETKLTEDELKPVASKPAAKELSPEELKKVTGGAVDIFLKLDGIPGVTTDDEHKD